MKDSRQKNDTLSALMTAAMALPGITTIGPVHAETGYRSDDVVLTYHRAHYAESGERMEIDVDQLALSLPVGERFEAAVEVVRDITSGASPVFYSINADGSPEMILQSGASIADERNVYRASVGYYGDDDYYGLGLGRSLEDDYDAHFASVDFRRSFDNKNTTLLASFAFSSDTVWNTYEPDVILNEPEQKNQRRKHDLMLGVSQVWDRNSVLQFNLTHSRAYGTLSDPYKLVTVENAGLLGLRGDFPYDYLIDFINETDGETIDAILDTLGLYQGLAQSGVDVAALREYIRNNNLASLINNSGLFDIGVLKELLIGALHDSRPDDRDQIIALARFSRYLQHSDSALHLDYRYAHDEWSSSSHTFEVKWKKAFGAGWMLAPGLRYYTQQAAYFYDAYFSGRRSDGYHSSDYRLAGFGAWSAKLEIGKALTENLFIQFNYEYYKRKHAWEWLSNTNGYAVDDYSAQTFAVSLQSVF